jgi:hypothetical protein
VYPTTPRPYDAVDIVARFESSVAAEFRRRNIQQDERAHLVYLNALRSIVDAGTTPMDDVEGYMSSPPRLNVPGAEILEPHSELVVPSVTSRMLSGTHNSSQYIEELQFSPPSSGPTSGTGPPAYTFDDTVLLSHGIATPQALQLLPTYRSEIPPVPNSVGSSNPAHDWNSVPLPPQQPIATRNFTTEQPIDSWLDLTLGTIDEKMVEPFEVAHPNASEPPSNLYRDEFDLHNAGQFDLNLYPISLDVNDNSDMNNMLELEAEHATATTEWKTKHDGNKALPQL